VEGAKLYEEGKRGVTTLLKFLSKIY